MTNRRRNANLGFEVLGRFDIITLIGVIDIGVEDLAQPTDWNVDPCRHLSCEILGL